MLLNNFKKLSFILCTGAMLVFTSCSGESTENNEIESTETEVIDATPRGLSDPNPSDEQGADENSTTSEDSPIINSGDDVGVTINPPHGEPGHDCAVPVGQPLTSATPAINTPSIETPQQINPVKINPPHGEPGHDCAVPVGDPLN